MNKNQVFEIGSRLVGGDAPTFIIAELSANHNHDFDEAVKLVEAAADAGADAVKVQTYTPDTITIDCRSEHFRIGEGTIWEGKNLYDLYAEAFMPWEWQPKLKQVAEGRGLEFFSTPFDQTSVEFLTEMDVPAFKIASFELVDHGLLAAVGKCSKPVIMSTGMASLGEIEDSVQVLRENGCEDLALLKCTSAYPAPVSEANLVTIPHLRDTFSAVVGLSDHTLGIAVPIAAVGKGARIVEKHFTNSRNLKGPDSEFSLEPHEFKTMVDAIRDAELADGSISYGGSISSQSSRNFRRSLFAVMDIKKGDLYTSENVRSIRPGYGLSPKYLPQILRARAASDIKRGTPLSWGLVVQ